MSPALNYFIDQPLSASPTSCPTTHIKPSSTMVVWLVLNDSSVLIPYDNRHIYTHTHSHESVYSDYANIDTVVSWIVRNK